MVNHTMGSTNDEMIEAMTLALAVMGQDLFDEVMRVIVTDISVPVEERERLTTLRDRVVPPPVKR